MRLESLSGGEGYEVQGGLCRLGEGLVAFVDRGLPAQGRVRQLGRSLMELEWEGVYLRPAVRDFLEELKSTDPEQE